MKKFLINIKRVLECLTQRIVLPLKSELLVLPLRIKKGRNVKFIGETILRTYSNGKIIIGDNVVFNSSNKKNLVGLTGPTIVCAQCNAEISIGANSGFSSVVINAMDGIRIGENVNIGGNVRIFDHDFHPLDWKDRRLPEKRDNIRKLPVCIGDDVFVGTNAIILKGTRIGDRSIIAAGSVVFGLDIPPDSMVKGNPAQLVPRNNKAK